MIEFKRANRSLY